MPRILEYKKNYSKTQNGWNKDQLDTLKQTNIAGWKINSANRKYIFKRFIIHDKLAVNRKKLYSIILAC